MTASPHYDSFVPFCGEKILHKNKKSRVSRFSAGALAGYSVSWAGTGEHLARIFLSYRSLDRTSALAVEQALRAKDHEVFLDCLPEAGITVGEDWERRLYDELYRSDAI